MQLRSHQACAEQHTVHVEHSAGGRRRAHPSPVRAYPAHVHLPAGLRHQRVRHDRGAHIRGNARQMLRNARKSVTFAETAQTNEPSPARRSIVRLSTRLFVLMCLTEQRASRIDLPSTSPSSCRPSTTSGSSATTSVRSSAQRTAAGWLWSSPATARLTYFLLLSDFHLCTQPLPKLDMIAIPDFAAGAMENCECDDDNMILTMRTASLTGRPSALPRPSRALPRSPSLLFLAVDVDCFHHQGV